MRTRTSKKLILLFGMILVAGLLRVTEANPAMAQSPVLGAWQVNTEPMLDGSAPEWQSILPVFLPMTSQQVTPPMGGGTVQRVAVRAVHFEERLFVMLEWFDGTVDQMSDGYEAFSDAAAVQFPAVAGSEVPAICMGLADQAVNIWHWRADQQQGPPSLPENGYVDMYPSTDDLFFTARAAGNPLSQQEDRLGVRSLVAGGFGTLEATDQGALEGYAVHSDGRWMVVFSRPFAPNGALEPGFGSETPIDVAFAVWDGSKGERNGIKSVSAFSQLRVSPVEPPRRGVAATDDWAAFTPPNPTLAIWIGFVLVLVGLMVAAALKKSGGNSRETPSDVDESKT